MIRRVIRLLGLAAVVLAAFDPSASASSAAPPTLIRLVSVTTSAKESDRLPKGPSTGDTVRETSRLLNEVAQFGKPARAAVGSDSAVQQLRLGPKSITVDGVAKLPGGTLLFRGKAERYARGGIVIPVVGGTGRYLGAQGTLWIVTVRDPARVLNVYRLTYARFA
jgi:hypothetical protein